jgi:hypothetical protein
MIENSSYFRIFILSTVFLVCLQILFTNISFCKPVCLSVDIYLSGPLAFQLTSGQTTQAHCDSQSVCLSVCLSIPLFIFVYIYACLLLFACVCLFVPNSACLFFCLLAKYPVYLSVCLSVCQCVVCLLFVF